MNKKEAFLKFGIKQKNERWSWAGISNDKSLVVLTIWTDQREWHQETKTFITSTFNCRNEVWRDSKGNIERIEIIKYCLDKLEGKFRVIFMTPKDKNVFEGTREYIKAVPYTKAWFKITDFNDQTGEFSSISIKK